MQNVFHSSLGDLLVEILGKYVTESDALAVPMFHIVTILIPSLSRSLWLWLCSSIYFMDSCIHRAMIMQTSPKKLYACSCVDIQRREEIGLTNNIKKDAKIITRCVVCAYMNPLLTKIARPEINSSHFGLEKFTKWRPEENRMKFKICRLKFRTQANRRTKCVRRSKNFVSLESVNRALSHFTIVKKF